MRLQIPTRNGTASYSSPPQTGMLQRKRAFGSAPEFDGSRVACGTRLQRKAHRSEPGAKSGEPVPPIVHEVLRSPGQSLDGQTRGLMEARFGHDFSRVRVHTDARAAQSAKAVNAQAYTLRRDVVFDSGKYSPTSATGQRLLAHELTHVVQQSGNGVSDPLSDALEAEAEQVAAAVQSGQAPVAVAHTSTPRLARQSASPETDTAETSATSTDFSQPVFVPGVAHNHTPTGRWAEVQAASSCANGQVECVCHFSSPEKVLSLASNFTMFFKPLAKKHLEHFRTGGGADLQENLEDVLRRDVGVRAVLAQMMRSTNRGHVRIEQSDYGVEDFQYAFGAIDRMDFEVNPATQMVHVWFKDYYEFHPVGFGYNSFPDDVKRETNCVHAAAVESKSTGSANFWMIGEAVVPQSLFVGSFTYGFGKSERDAEHIVP